MFSVTPRPTEKAYGMSANNNLYTFDVPVVATKLDIKKAVETKYGVIVTSVRTVRQSGKSIRFSRGKNRYPGETNRQDTKKAYVSLAKGNSIAILNDQVEQETK